MESQPMIQRASVFSRLVVPGVATIVIMLAFAIADPLRGFLLWISIPVLVIGLQLAVALSWTALQRRSGEIQ